MAEPLLALSIASAIIDLTSITLSIIATLYSGAYNKERALRKFGEAGDGFDELDRCLRLLGDHERSIRTQLKALWECQEQTRHMPIFWRLQSWISKTATNYLPSPVHNWFAIFSPESPTPHGLLLSWIVLAVATATYCRSREGFQYEGYCLVGSMTLACVVGMLESSERATVILMDIPWCLTIGMMLHMIVRGMLRRFGAKRIRRDGVSCGLPPMALSQDVEKIAGNDD
ncbi:hypothetical protein E8E11_004333 [Didymella keratinophila]|nr:hypothetical protein E8E11_004333 [Didymella keratinophila]